LKKERNCNMNPYPVYPTYPGMMPIQNQGMMPMIPNQMMGQNMAMPNNIMMPTVPNSTMNQNISGIDSQLSAINSQINNLERRVSRLESSIGASNNVTPKYSESNYYMV